MKLKNPEVRIESTNLCDDHCSICPRDKLKRKPAVMDAYHYRFLIDQAVELGAQLITLDGFGEPLVDPNLTSKIRYASNRGLKTYFSTNARSLTESTAIAILEAGLSRIRFSLFPGSAGRVDKIFRFAGINRMQFAGRCEMNLNVVDSDPKHIAAIRRIWEPVVDHLEIWRPHNWTDGKSFRKLTIWRKKTCGRPDSGPIQIAADGTVGVCCFDFNYTLKVGDSRVSRLEDIIKGEAFKRIRRAHHTGSHRGLICETCDQLNIENDSPLLYSTRDPDRSIGKTSTLKFDMRRDESIL